MRASKKLAADYFTCERTGENVAVSTVLFDPPAHYGGLVDMTYEAETAIFASRPGQESRLCDIPWRGRATVAENHHRAILCRALRGATDTKDED